MRGRTKQFYNHICFRDKFGNDICEMHYVCVATGVAGCITLCHPITVSSMITYFRSIRHVDQTGSCIQMQTGLNDSHKQWLIKAG